MISSSCVKYLHIEAVKMYGTFQKRVVSTERHYYRVISMATPWLGKRLCICTATMSRAFSIRGVLR
jgi:hypothetical protein